MLKSTGIVRNLDDLGRITIPKELRRSLHLQEGDSMEILLDGNTIGLRKWSDTVYDWNSMFALAKLYLGECRFTLYDVSGHIQKTNEDNPPSAPPTGANLIYANCTLIGFLNADPSNKAVDTATEVLTIFLEASGGGKQ